MSRTPWGLHEDHFLCTLALRSASADGSAVQEGRVSSALHGGGLNLMQRRALPRGWISPALAKSKAYLTECRKQRPKQGEGRFSCAVPCLAVLWADGERAGDDGMAVVSGKWAPEAAVGGRAHIFSSALPVGRPFKPSVFPTSSKKKIRRS
jgi:hypothetical protein